MYVREAYKHGKIMIHPLLLLSQFMSNRGRQNVASYLVLDLGLDWRLGADYFESLLLDHDVCSNYGNWNSAAGLTGGRINRFNIAKQSRDYDPQAMYIKTWLPELKNVPLQHVFEPWKMPRKVQDSCSCVIGTDYPIPVQTSFQRRNDDMPKPPGRIRWYLCLH